MVRNRSSVSPRVSVRFFRDRSLKQECKQSHEFLVPNAKDIGKFVDGNFNSYLRLD